jgi:MAF protein
VNPQAEIPSLVLASASPRRSELLRTLTTNFEVLPVDVDEVPHGGEAALAYTGRVAMEKARAARRLRPGAWILAADTIVELDGSILGKPAGRGAAAAMLRRLSGRAHRVHTAVVLVDPDGAARVDEVVTSRVRFRVLTAEEIDGYVATEEPHDKAGAYAVQGAGGRFVEAVEGSLSNVVGLPLELLGHALRAHALVNQREASASAVRGAPGASVVSERYARVRERVAVAAQRSGRTPADVTIVVVTKGFGVDAVRAAFTAGARDIGENFVQEAAAKIAAFGDADRVDGVDRARWHHIGVLQRNKARHAATLFDVLHTVADLDIARRVARAAAEAGKKIPVLIQIDLAGTPGRHGVRPTDAPHLIEAATRLPALVVVGLMTVPPPVPEAAVEAARSHFRRLAALRADLVTRGFDLPHLSMGMTDDFEVAIEEGATMIRVGRAVFGPRPARRAAHDATSTT